MITREDFIHFHARQALAKNGWQLIAGQYPNGSDDELPSLNIMDPALARDHSPDHRRHSQNKLVPDLVAHKGGYILIVEAKPRYNVADEGKLQIILNDRRIDFVTSLQNLIKIRKLNIAADVNKMSLVPCLCFSAPLSYETKPGFSYFVIRSKTKRLVCNNLMPPEFEINENE